jgi:hypothetical protein
MIKDLRYGDIYGAMTIFQNHYTTRQIYVLRQLVKSFLDMKQNGKTFDEYTAALDTQIALITDAHGGSSSFFEKLKIAQLHDSLLDDHDIHKIQARAKDFDTYTKAKQDMRQTLSANGALNAKTPSATDHNTMILATDNTPTTKTLPAIDDKINGDEQYPQTTSVVYKGLGHGPQRDDTLSTSNSQTPQINAIFACGVPNTLQSPPSGPTTAHEPLGQQAQPIRCN